jgi:hypothetical protein
MLPSLHNRTGQQLFNPHFLAPAVEPAPLRASEPRAPAGSRRLMRNSAGASQGGVFL